jgi:hypothetical protein
MISPSPQIEGRGSFPSFNIHFRMPCHPGSYYSVSYDNSICRPPPNSEASKRRDIHLVLTHDAHFNHFWTCHQPIFEQHMSPLCPRHVSIVTSGRHIIFWRSSSSKCSYSVPKLVPSISMV